MVKCVVSGCPNRTVNGNRGGFLSRKPKRFFPFPRDPTRVKVWLAALRETDNEELTEQQLICEDHFLPEDVSARGVAGDAIPIMPPCPDRPMGLTNPWGVDSSEEEEQFVDDDDPSSPQGDPGGGLSSPPESARSRTPSRSGAEASLPTLTQRFLRLLLEAPDGSVNLREVTQSLQTHRQRLFEITNVLDGIRLVKKESGNRIKWIGSPPISSFLWRNKLKFQKELENLQLVESTLDGLIKTCAQQLFSLTDDEENSSSAYVTQQDVGRLPVFQDQTVIVVKAPEETKLEIPVPSEDRVQIHLKAGRGSVTVWTCDVEPSGSGSGSGSGSFLALEESRVRTATLHSGPQAE
ncbi:transcription factor E2F6 [Brachionichthys hirsutus]|uniref:transcription factor E2F6 n=1 Tax=Brachionichthys hirsutus TaxID=412623 RepID=UPI00360463CC